MVWYTNITQFPLPTKVEGLNILIKLSQYDTSTLLPVSCETREASIMFGTSTSWNTVWHCNCVLPIPDTHTHKTSPACPKNGKTKFPHHNFAQELPETLRQNLTLHAAYANTTIMHYETHFTMPRYACHSLRPQTLLKNKEAVCSQLTLILEVVSLKCSVGPSGRCEITIPLGFFLSSFITITSV